MITCPNCQHAMIGQPTVCENCGAPLAGEAGSDTIVVPKNEVEKQAKPTARLDDFVMCPECLHQNLIGTLFCEKCARDLSDLDQEVQQSVEATLRLEDTARFISIKPGREMVLGRHDPESASMPDVDLSPYQGLTRGVSRVHAVLRWESGSLYITDLASTNGTFVNEQRLMAHQPFRLKHGDILHLGKLGMRVSFSA